MVLRFCVELQISDAEREHAHALTRISELESEVLRHEENQVSERHSEERIQDLEGMLASNESQFRERVFCLESQLEELAQRKSETEDRVSSLEETLQQRDRHHSLIVKNQEELRVKLERERDDLRIRCLELEAKIVQLEVAAETVYFIRRSRTL
ncbi:hypothetical protein NVRI1_00332 [Chlamydia abortus]|nr:hypothetical protein [Chlamydia abortus]CAG9045994.1 hypothetical protein NVRI1_00332 [Chlamydia abortus]